MLGKQWDSEIVAIGDQIVQLTLLQTRELSEYMEQVHGVKPSGGSIMLQPEIPLPQQAVAVQTEFAVQIDSFDPTKKIALIKTVREITGLGLKEAKELVEMTPKILKESMPRADAEALQKKLEENGGKVTLK